MFKSIKRSVAIIAGVVLFTCGVLVGSGQWTLTRDAVDTWNQAVTDVVDVEKTKEYISGFLPKSMETWEETILNLVSSLTEKIFS